MGKIQLDHTGAGAGITLSSDGTDLLLDGTAIGGGGGTALELYAENPSTDAVAIGRGASATPSQSYAIGFNAVAATNSGAMALGKSFASGTDSFAAAITSNSSGFGATGANSIAIGTFARATSTSAVAIGRFPVATSGESATAIGKSFASGADSFAAAIANNTSSFGATGANSVAIGDRNKASGGYSVSLGRLNQSTGINSTSLGIFSVASSKYSLAVGNEASTRSTSSISFSAGSFSGIAGQHQISMFAFRQRTTDATPTLLLTDGGTTGSTDDQIILPNNAAFAFHGTIVARQQASQGTACAAFKIEGLIRREGSAATTVLVNSATTVLDNTPAWGMTLSADTTNGGLKIEVTGAAATNIAWNGNIHTSEVTY